MNVQARICRQLTEEGSQLREYGPHQSLCILQWSSKVFCWSSAKMGWHRSPSGYWMGGRDNKENSWRWGQETPPAGDLRPRWPTQHLYLDCPLNSLPNLCELGITVFILQLGTWGTEEKQPKIIQEGRRRQALEQSYRSLVLRRTMAHWLAVSYSKPDTTALIHFAGSGSLNWPGYVTSLNWTVVMSKI